MTDPGSGWVGGGRLAHLKPRGRARRGRGGPVGDARPCRGLQFSRSRGRRVAPWGTRRERRTESLGDRTLSAPQPGLEPVAPPDPRLVFISQQSVCLYVVVMEKGDLKA